MKRDTRGVYQHFRYRLSIDACPGRWFPREPVPKKFSRTTIQFSSPRRNVTRVTRGNYETICSRLLRFLHRGRKERTKNTPEKSI